MKWYVDKCIHPYENYGSFGVTIISGEINRGESKCVELSLASIGVRNARYSSISNALLRKLMLGGMPWSFDDPDTADQLMRILQIYSLGLGVRVGVGGLAYTVVVSSGVGDCSTLLYQVKESHDRT